MVARARRWAKRASRNRYRGAIARLRVAWGGRCTCPGCDECRRSEAEGVPCDRRWRLQFAHVKPTPLSGVARGRGRAERYHDIKRHPDHYRLMCWWCHRELDGGVSPQAFGPPVEYDEPMEEGSAA